MAVLLAFTTCVLLHTEKPVISRQISQSSGTEKDRTAKMKSLKSLVKYTLYYHTYFNY